MDHTAQNKRKLQPSSRSHSTKKLLKGDTRTHSCNSATEFTCSLPADYLEAPVCQMLNVNEPKVIEGATYEIDQKNLPSDAPADIRSIRTVLVTEVSGPHITVIYPSAPALHKFFGKEDYPMDLQNTPRSKLTRYGLQLGPVDPLMGTKPELDAKFVMCGRTAKRVLARSISCTEYLHQAHLKSFWLTAPDSTQSSDVNCKVRASDRRKYKVGGPSASDEDSDGVNHPPLKLLEDIQPKNDVMMDGERVTRDLCINFQDAVTTPAPKVVRLWKSTSTSPTGMDLQSGLSTEEGIAKTSDAAEVTVKAAAELLTQLVTYNDGRHVAEGVSPDRTAARTFSPQEEPAGEGPIRWGYRKKVIFDNRRNVDSCDLGLDSGLVLRPPNEGKILLNLPDEKVQETYVPYDFTAGKWSSSTSPASSELYRQLRSAVVAGGFRRKSPTVSQGQKDRPCKSPPTRNAVNILKLPKDMQGRWSSERYKSAQLKLIDIMRARRAVPGKPILRPALREEARKHIGDTGLLDHLLKHMTDTVVSTGERFRRRHNAEGAMEYWLEHASLMDLRKAAGVEDPSWIPPPGWKPGDILPGRHWGMSTAEAAEMKQLKETVEKLRSEMKLLCGRFKGSSQKGDAQSSAGDQKRFQSVHSSKVDEEVIERITNGMIEFKKELKTLQEQFDQDQKAGSNLLLTLDRFQRLENEVQQLSEDRKMQQELSMPVNKDLEGQLQDVRKAVTMMQADVSCIMKTLGFAAQPVLGKASPIRQLTESSAGGDPMPMIISSGENIHLTKLVSAEPGPPGTSLVCGIAANNHEVTMRHCTILKSATSSSNGCNPVDDYKNLTNEGLSRALSQYNMVNQKLRTPHENKNHKHPTAITAITIDSAAPVMSNNQRKRAPECVPPQEYRDIWKSGSTGFKVYRPSGSFVWPSTMNLTHFNPLYPASNTADVQEVRVEDILRTASPRILGISASSAISSSVQTNHSARSIGESHVAATMAGMFGCMAQQPGMKVDNPVEGSSAKCSFLPRTVHLPQRLNHFVGHTGSTGSYYHAPPEHAVRSELPRHLHAQRPCPLNQTKFSPTNPQQQWQLNSSEASPTFPTLPLINTALIEAGGNNAMMTTTNLVQSLSSTTTSGPSLSLALSLSLGSPTPAIDSGKAPLKKSSV